MIGCKAIMFFVISVCRIFCSRKLGSQVGTFRENQIRQNITVNFYVIHIAKVKGTSETDQFRHFREVFIAGKFNLHSRLIISRQDRIISFGGQSFRDRFDKFKIIARSEYRNKHHGRMTVHQRQVFFLRFVIFRIKHHTVFSIFVSICFYIPNHASKQRLTFPEYQILTVGFIKMRIVIDAHDLIDFICDVVHLSQSIAKYALPSNSDIF